MKYRKTALIEATQWHKNGDHPLDYAGTFEGLEEGEYRTWTGEEAKALGWEGKVVRRYLLPEMDGAHVCGQCGNTMHDHGWIDTLEGGHVVCPGDWIATGAKGEHWPIKPDIFDATYEPVA